MSWIDELLGGTSRSAVAGGMGAPVDAAALALNALIAGGGYLGHKAGVLKTPPEMIENPVGGSEWIAGKMRGMGLLRDTPGTTADSWGNALGGLLGPLTAAKAPAIARGLLQGEANLAAPRTLDPQTGAIVWHGSPHKFDKFAISENMGRGEGVQAYGHGLYLADNKAVGQGYADNLSASKGQKWEYDGVKVAKPGDAGNRWSLAGIDWLNRSGFDKARAIENIKADWAASGNSIKGKEFRELKKWIDDADVSKITRDQSLYKVDLPDDQIAKMLDWDKPLSQQSPEVQAASRRRLDEIRATGGSTPDDPSGEWLHKAFIPQAGGQAAAADRLRQAGIPGIRFLDGNSRGAGAGTSNYVVFPGEENMLTILERNGKRIP